MAKQWDMFADNRPIEPVYEKVTVRTVATGSSGAQAAGSIIYILGFLVALVFVILSFSAFFGHCVGPAC